MNIKGYKRKGGKFLLYPSCEHCNSLLGATKATTFYDRLEVLSTKYEKKLNKIERWTEQELEEMGHTLRTFIQGNQCEFEYFERKLSAVEDKILKVELGELSEEGVELESTKLH